VGAAYAALGVIDPSGSGLQQFVHVGLEPATAARIGHLPQGKGLLGALIDDPRPVRLGHISDDPRSVGFPEHHPPMGAFLGVPLRVRDEVFGNLYLTRTDDRPFTREDEELVASLAGTAGVAIENARLFDESQRRQDWLRASTEITRQLLARDGEEPLRLIARSLLRLADADAVNVVLPAPRDGRLLIEVAEGVSAEHLTGLSYPGENTLSREVLANAAPLLVPDMTETDYVVHLADYTVVGPLLAVPLVGQQRARGVLLVARQHGRPRFTEADLDMATTFANHAALALELADARDDQQRVVLLEDRERIARDLHDHVIQRLFASGLTVESVAAGLGGDPRGRRLAEIVEDIDGTIRQIRTSIFQLRGPLSNRTGTVRRQVLGVVAEVTPVLGFDPRVTFAGPVDIAVPEALVADVVAVVRETLTNVGRHAQARSAGVDVRATATTLEIVVTDDGRGIGAQARRSGLANLRARARGHGGDLEIAPSPGATGTEGTCLRWTVRLA
jgi:signal transduction histidine kinase